MNDLEINTNKNNNIRYLYRDVNEFKKHHQPRINLGRDENGDILAGSHNISCRWKNSVG
jgi:hypothetical protein